VNFRIIEVLVLKTICLAALEAFTLLHYSSILGFGCLASVVFVGKNAFSPCRWLGTSILHSKFD